MEQVLDLLIEQMKKYSPFIVAGAVGATIHRLRTKMSLKKFIISVVISIFVAFSVGVVCRDYFKLQETIIFVLCGISGTFSNSILDEIEEIIKNFSKTFMNRFK